MSKPLTEEENRIRCYREEEAATQSALVDLAHALGIDAELRWDHDSCPNNSEIVRELQSAVAPLVEALRKIEGMAENREHDLVSNPEAPAFHMLAEIGDCARAALAGLEEKE